MQFQSIDPKKIDIARKADEFAHKQWLEVGERRRQIHEHLIHCRRNGNSPEARAQLPSLEKSASDVEQEFVPKYQAYLDSRRFVERCAGWLANQRLPIPPTPEKPKIKFGQAAPLYQNSAPEELFKRLEEVRAATVQISEERLEVETAPLRSKTLITQKSAEVDTVLGVLCDPKRHIETSDISLLFIATHADQLKKSLAAHIEKAVGKNGLDQDEKQERYKELDRRLDALLIEEEQICLAIEAADAFVVRRVEFSPAVFFAVSVEGSSA